MLMLFCGHCRDRDTTSVGLKQAAIAIRSGVCGISIARCRAAGRNFGFGVEWRDFAVRRCHYIFTECH